VRLRTGLDLRELACLFWCEQEWESPAAILEVGFPGRGLGRRLIQLGKAAAGRSPITVQRRTFRGRRKWSPSARCIVRRSSQIAKSFSCQRQRQRMDRSGAVAWRMRKVIMDRMLTHEGMGRPHSVTLLRKVDDLLTPLPQEDLPVAFIDVMKD
jgi:hypothetical protein